MNILITGAGGFIGRNLSEYLADRSHVFAAGYGDLDLLDESAVKEYIEKNRIEVIIHCAAVGGSRKSNYDLNRIDIVEKNLRMFFNLQRCLTPDMRMIQLGSGAEYDRLHWRPKMPEDYFDQHVPGDSYGYSKYVISKYLDNTVNITCLRIFGLFGKYEDYRYKFISNAIVKNLVRMPIVIYQNVLFDYLYIDDLVRIIEQVIHEMPARKHYNVTPAESIDILTVAGIINQVSDFKSEIRVLSDGMNTEYTGDSSRLLSELGDFKFTGYREAIAALFRYYQTVLDALDVKAVQSDAYLESCRSSRST